MELGSASTRSRDLDDSGRPAKQAKVSAPAQQIMAAMEIGHEDEPNLTQFLDEELDYMEDYDYNIEDEQVTDENFEGDLESMPDRLSRPYSKEEPMMDVEELQELDALADLVEITRLQQQGVLIPLGQVEEDDIKTLSTKFVRSYVAREFAWLTPDREDLFSPASSAVVSRLLPYCYLKRAAREEKTLSKGSYSGAPPTPRSQDRSSCTGSSCCSSPPRWTLYQPRALLWHYDFWGGLPSFIERVTLKHSKVRSVQWSGIIPPPFLLPGLISYLFFLLNTPIPVTSIRLLGGFSPSSPVTPIGSRFESLLLLSVCRSVDYPIIGSIQALMMRGFCLIGLSVTCVDIVFTQISLQVH